MNFLKSELRIEYMRGTGPGGQHRNKTESACRITHIPTGVSAYADYRKRRHSYKEAMSVLTDRLLQAKQDERAQARKDRRDKIIHECRTIRTYDFRTGIVKNHLNGKTASLKNVLVKGKIHLLQEDTQQTEST